jgi:spore coat protein CotF
LANLTSKELSAIEDQASQEQTLVKKYQAMSSMCTDTKIQQCLNDYAASISSTSIHWYHFYNTGGTDTMTTNQVLTAQDILQRFSHQRKHMTDTYNLYAGECVNQQLRSTMLNILNDVHTIQADIFSTMQQNGWYQVEPAEQQKIQKARQKFSAS